MKRFVQTFGFLCGIGFATVAYAGGGVWMDAPAGVLWGSYSATDVGPTVATSGYSFGSVLVANPAVCGSTSYRVATFSGVGTFAAGCWLYASTNATGTYYRIGQICSGAGTGTGFFTGSAPWSSVPSSVTNCVLARAVKNETFLYQRLFVNYRYGDGGLLQGYVTNVPPAATHSIDLKSTGTNCPILLTYWWEEGPMSTQASTNIVMTNAYSIQLVTSNSLLGDLIPFAAPLTTNVPSPVVMPTQVPRVTNYSDSATAVKTLDSNADARAREMAGLMVQQSRAQRQEAAALMEMAAQAADQAHRDATNTQAALGGLANALTNTPGGSGSVTNAIALALPGGTSNTLFALAGNPGTIGKVSPVVSIPFSSLNAGLTDYELNFGSAYLTGGIGDKLVTTSSAIRTFLLFIVTVSFLVASFKMVGKAVWS